MSGSLLDNNLSQLNLLLSNFSDEPIRHFIDGQWVDSSNSDVFTNSSPIDESVIGNVASGTNQDIDKACEAAQGAFPDWAGLSGANRRDLLHAIANAIEANAEEIALVESWDTGQPFRFMSKAAVR